MLDTNLIGSDIAGFNVASGRAVDCDTLCNQNPACVAWTLVAAGIQGPFAKCWIKNNVPPPTTSTCCTSGLKRYVRAGSKRENLPEFR